MSQALALVSGIPRMQTVPASGSASVYDQTYIPTGTIAAGTAVTIPLSMTYTSDELQVFVNGSKLNLLYDYAYVGTAPRTQVTFTFDLYVTDKVDFRIDNSNSNSVVNQSMINSLIFG